MNIVFSKNNFINDILILVFQVYIKRGTFHFILKNKSICILHNRNIQITMREGGIDSINATFDLFPFFVREFYLSPHTCYFTFYTVDYSNVCF